MGVHLVTGYAGKEHITSADHGAYNAGTYGPGKYVLRTGNMFAAEVISNNLIKIKDGDLINQGRHINIAVNDYEECEIDNGQQSLKRNDLIVVRYTKNNETMIETAQVLVLKGVPSATPADPEYVTGDILNGAETDDFPLYRVRLNGLSIEKVEPLFSTIVSVKDILSLIGNKDISKLGDGTITGGLSALNTDLAGKQPKLINPLVQADVINSVSSTLTNKPLSAAQGRALNVKLVGETNYAWVTTGTYINAQYIQRCGIVSVIVSMPPKKTIPIGGWTVLTNLPSGYRPVANIPFSLVYGNYVYSGFVYTNGNIVIYTDAELGANYVLMGNVSYPVDDFK